MEEKRKRLTAKREFEMYLEVKRDGANVGEILRRYGVHLNDLRQIEAVVEQAAVKALRGREDIKAGWQRNRSAPRSIGKACEVMGISVRRFQDWWRRAQSGERDQLCAIS